MSGLVNSVGARSIIVGTGGLGNMVGYRASSTSTLTGWSEYTSARGRMIVGLPSGGTDGGTVGTALTNAQDKSKSIAHDHTMSSHKHTVSFHQQPTVVYHDDTTGAVFGNSSTSVTPNGANTWTANDGTHPSTTINGDLTDANNDATAGMSANDAVVTSDILAYIQLMAIKKD